MVHIVRWEIKTYCQSLFVWVSEWKKRQYLLPETKTRSLKGRISVYECKGGKKGGGEEKTEERTGEVFMCFDLMVPQIHWSVSWIVSHLSITGEAIHHLNKAAINSREIINLPNAAVIYLNAPGDVSERLRFNVSFILFMEHVGVVMCDHTAGLRTRSS